eukprot:5016728-Alexandrium_andersonii.AAC.1
MCIRDRECSEDRRPKPRPFASTKRCSCRKAPVHPTTLGEALGSCNQLAREPLPLGIFQRQARNAHADGTFESMAPEFQH